MTLSPLARAGRSAGGATTGGLRRPSLATMLCAGGAGLLVLLLLLVAALGTIGIYVALGVAALTALLATLGLDRVGLLLLVGAFFTAPFYKGVAPSEAAQVTLPDGLLALGFVLLFPRMLRGRISLPVPYLLGLGVVFGTGLVATIMSSDLAVSLFSLILWMSVIALLPIGLALWSPDRRIIDVLAATYVAGHIFSFFAGIAKGYIGQGRWAGLTTHPNYLAQAGLLSLCLLFFLWFRHGRRMSWPTVLILGAAAICGATVFLSGSRAATLVLAVLIVMIPIAERSAIAGFALAGLAALGLVALPLIVDISGEDSSIGRLAGGGGASYADAERREGLAYGLERFWDHPLRGSGLIDLITIHNNYLEILVAIGVFGFLGYVLVMATFALPLFGRGEYRRLAWVAWAYIGFGAFVPAIYDRSVWVPLALGAIALFRASDPDPPPGQVTVAPTPATVPPRTTASPLARTTQRRGSRFVPTTRTTG